ncbi:PQQ-dependent sugar dehydrogenase [Ureibacillus sp. FSL W8-0352]|uniref:PQQ-dependent sugar dehydrogenase n=1 Tax=Ureibacillus sp. FSL W8-0352 TaxID=2954596 RepID=UPI0030F65AF2
MKALIPIIIIAFFITGCSPKQPQPPKVAETAVHQTIETTANIQIEEIASNLQIPWSIEKIGDIFYLSERRGNIVKVENGNIERQEVHFEKRLSSAAEAGFLGFVLAPDFSQTNEAYGYYTYEDEFGQYNRIVRLKLNENRWTEEEILLDKIPSGRVHHGGRLKIGPDGMLYATTGDALRSSIAQDVNSLGGKILRIQLDGSIPSDNPLPNSYAFSYGHRNPQGLTWVSDGTMYASEHGNQANDEINRIEKGENYGWPIIEGTEQRDGMISPLFTSGPNKTWAPSGMDYFDNKLYVAALRGNAILEFNLNTMEQKEVVNNLGRIRDILIEGDYLYFITNNADGRGNPRENDDKLYRLAISNIE